jgi:group I intron endonuclease
MREGIYYMYGVIYKITSKIDGRVYIGQTVNFKRRYGQYKYAAKSKISTSMYIERAMRKHGFDNFDFCIIDKASSKEELNQKEKTWISIYHSTATDKGFNIQDGGRNTEGYFRKSNPLDKKLNWIIINEIRENKDKLNYKQLQDKYNINRDHLVKILRNKIWFDKDSCDKIAYNKIIINNGANLNLLNKTLEYSKRNKTLADMAAYIICNFEMELNENPEDCTEVVDHFFKLNNRETK